MSFVYLLYCSFCRIKNQCHVISNIFVFFVTNLAQSPGAESGAVEGILTRKHEWESTTKKASNRSWDKVSESNHHLKQHLVNTMLFSPLHSGIHCCSWCPPSILQRPEVIQVCAGANVPWRTTVSIRRSHRRSRQRLHKEEACLQNKVSHSEYIQRMKQQYPHLTQIRYFPLQSQIRLVNGGEFLLQAHDDIELNQWVGALNGQCQGASGGESRSQTLPATSQQKDESKRKSFFTLKKK